ncbi:hypothetical protein ACFFV7_50160 [Nonomuraea spiralis]|uniref:PA domain-containing protein n=1 Tax=Nonomuraea spiralis TaxID=46182 RepID=A0ABV5IY10_9ACTN|nr:hypothetical protein [Nonomuraea spiralis]GGS89645.1 hypothetical protein GCM10010176_036950 [Nonomuraea spiralis]
MRRLALLALLLPLVAPAQPALAQAAAPAVCPVRVDPAAFASEARLSTLAGQQAAFGPRPTGSAAHAGYVDWLEDEMGAIPGLQLSSQPYTIDRWDNLGTGLTVGGAAVQVAAPVPFSSSTGAGGVSAPLVHLAAGTNITAANAAGKIVVRDLPWTSVPNLLFYPPTLGYSMYDPGLTINLLGSESMEAPAAADADLKAAAAAGALGVIEISQLPHAQIKDMYAPYEGLPYGVPGAYVGADQGKQIKAALAAGQPVQGALTVNAAWTPTTTRTLFATLPGGSDQKIVVESHTDGMSAVWDNGPLTMIEMARYLSSLPVECRPRTVQFAFVTGHLYQHLTGPDVREGGAGQLAAQLDAQYDQGKVSSVVVLEHLGAKRYDAVARPNGLPGKQLVASPTLTELLWVPVSESTPLRELVKGHIEYWDVRRTAILKGLSAADLATVPRHCSFGGEGTPYNQHLLPVIAPIAAPKTLFSPQFGPEAIDLPVMRKASLAFTDVVLDLGPMAQSDVAGDVTAMRQQRASGTPGCA